MIAQRFRWGLPPPGLSSSGRGKRDIESVAPSLGERLDSRRRISRKKRPMVQPARLIMAIGLVLVAVACSKPPTGSPAPAAGASPGVQSEWDQVLAEAKKEGSVNVIGLQGENTRE